jgi:uncharacterized SAM-binding protein YcdF (DUF218 family)
VLLALWLPVTVATATWFGRGWLLRAAADLWIVSDGVVPADAVVVLGGGISTRPFAARAYYQNGLVPKILLSNVQDYKTEGIGIEAALTRSELVLLGVPDSAIEVFGSGLSNTYEEALALREWVSRSSARTIIVPTEMFSARRLRWILNHELAGTGTQIRVPALDGPDYNRSNWWRNQQALISFRNEIVKYTYYRLRYWK